ncbi:hypothetical protein [Streptococcus thoraltensis]|uniref:hypothetical protein n=1 Tax=Streptococcus thoraltensis TaxID=55085 RepID=UPI000374E756|nr:hypothetical protein [Streptococcus thoraltensis]MDY4762388.1 hypothetical protein [Streptococcus thoraltensis]
MTKKNPLQESITKRLSDERYTPPKEEKKKKTFDFQLIIILTILGGLITSIVSLIKYFFN